MLNPYGTGGLALLVPWLVRGLREVEKKTVFLPKFLLKILVLCALCTLTAV